MCRSLHVCMFALSKLWHLTANWFYTCTLALAFWLAFCDHAYYIIQDCISQIVFYTCTLAFWLAFCDHVSVLVCYINCLGYSWISIPLSKKNSWIDLIWWRTHNRDIYTNTKTHGHENAQTHTHSSCSACSYPPCSFFLIYGIKVSVSVCLCHYVSASLVLCGFVFKCFCITVSLCLCGPVSVSLPLCISASLCLDCKWTHKRDTIVSSTHL